MTRPLLDLDELSEALLAAQEMPTGLLADNFSTLLLSLEVPGPCWLSPEETHACWTQLVARGYLTAH